jgi:hypothetical protein
MSGSNRDDYSQIGRIGILALIIVAWAAMIWSMSAHYAAKRVRAEAATAQYAQSAAEQIERACASRSGLPLRECIREQVEANRGDQRSEQDLSAQQEMADWAFWMMVVSAVTMVLTAIALWFVRGTLEATREAVKDTSEATEAMRQANQIAAAAQRPWLTFSAKLAKAAGVNEKGLKLTFDVVIKNVGSSPAISCHLNGKMFNTLRGGDGVETYTVKADTFIAEHAQETAAADKAGFIVAPNEEITKNYSIGLSRDQFGALEGYDGLALYPVAIFSLCYRATTDAEIFGQTAKGILIHNKAWVGGDIQFGGLAATYLKVAEAVNIGTAT